VHGDGVHAGMVAHGVNALDRRHRGGHGRRLQEESIADALGGDGPSTCTASPSATRNVISTSATPGRAIEHLGYTTAHATVDLDDARSVGVNLISECRQPVVTPRALIADVARSSTAA
jgi:hypothetical protein